MAEADFRFKSGISPDIPMHRNGTGKEKEIHLALAEILSQGLVITIPPPQEEGAERKYCEWEICLHRILSLSS